MVHIAIVEDEDIYRDRLKQYIEQYRSETGRECKVTYFQDGDEIAINYSGTYDIILMDIQMQFMDGMTAARKIREMDNKVIIIFITNMIQYAVQGYQVDALDYIVKPVEYFSFAQKLTKAIERVENNDERYIAVKTDNGVRKIMIDSLLYIESSSHYLNFVTVSDVYETRLTMKYIEELLAPYDFCRIHKGYLVNMKHVEGIEENNCIMRGNVRIPVSRNNRKLFMERLTDCIGKEV